MLLAVMNRKNDPGLCFCFRHHDIAPSSEVMNEMKVSLPSRTSHITPAYVLFVF